jgi:cobalamin biosynthesis protein CobD/CbiB
MNHEWLKLIIGKILEQSWGFIMPVFITLSVLIFSPAFRAWAGAEAFYSGHRAAFSIVFLYFSSCIAYKSAVAFIAEIKRRREAERARKEKERLDAIWKKMPRRGQM